MTIYFSIALGVVAFILFVVRCKDGRSVQGVFTKNATSLFFVATAGIALLRHPFAYEYGVMILLGLVLGMLGDIYLDQKWVYPDDSDKYLYAGFISFGIGHLFYIPAIYYTAHKFGLSYSLVWIPIVFAAVVCAFVLLTEKATKQDFGKFRPIVAVYGMVVAGMAGTSILAAIVTAQPTFIVCAVGGVMFLISDLILSPMYFGPKEKNNFPNFFINHLTYYIAQFLLAYSIYLLPELA